MLHIALYQPKIPPNTGTTARQCVGMQAHLHLIGPHNFDLSDHAVKRAGLDYWPHLTLSEHAAPETFFNWLNESGRRLWIVTKFGPQRYDEPAYADEDVILFGSETTGLPEWIHRHYAEQAVYIPILGNVRSYNLANAVAIVLAQASLKAGVFEQHTHSPNRARTAATQHHDPQSSSRGTGT